MTDMFQDSLTESKPQVQPLDTSPTYKYHMVELPSKGKFGYPSTMEYRDILVKDEKMVATATPDTFQKVLNNVLKGLLKDSSYFEKLTSDDRDFLLTWIWANNYPTKRKLEYACGHCETKQTTEIDIVELDVIELADDFEINEYELRDGRKVKIKPITVKDEETVLKFSKANGVDEWFVAQCLCIDTGTVMPLKAKIDFIENNISGYDMAKIRGIIKDMKFGVPNTTMVRCNSCGEDNQIDIPFQVDFFLPTL